MATYYARAASANAYAGSDIRFCKRYGTWNSCKIMIERKPCWKGAQQNRSARNIPTHHERKHKLCLLTSTVIFIRIVTCRSIARERAGRQTRFRGDGFLEINPLRSGIVVDTGYEWSTNISADTKMKGVFCRSVLTLYNRKPRQSRRFKWLDCRCSGSY
jgi:hypothetical protein